MGFSVITKVRNSIENHVYLSEFSHHTRAHGNGSNQLPKNLCHPTVVAMVLIRGLIYLSFSAVGILTITLTDWCDRHYLSACAPPRNWTRGCTGSNYIFILILVLRSITRTKIVLHYTHFVLWYPMCTGGWLTPCESNQVYIIFLNIQKVCLIIID